MTIYSSVYYNWILTHFVKLLAWIPGGYGLFHAKLADLIHSVAPRRDTILIRTPLKVECADRIIGDDDDVKTNSALPNPTKCPSLPPLTG